VGSSPPGAGGGSSLLTTCPLLLRTMPAADATARAMLEPAALPRRLLGRERAPASWLALSCGMMAADKPPSRGSAGSISLMDLRGGGMTAPAIAPPSISSAATATPASSAICTTPCTCCAADMLMASRSRNWRSPPAAEAEAASCCCCSEPASIVTPVTDSCDSRTLG
jgi:hypothetical protein